MTTNAFILSWDQLGIEAVVPITQYEDWDHQNLVNVLAGAKKKRQSPESTFGQASYASSFQFATATMKFMPLTATKK